MTACKNLKALQWATTDDYSIKVWMVNDIICSMEINTMLLSNECDAWQNNWLIATMSQVLSLTTELWFKIMFHPN